MIYAAALSACLASAVAGASVAGATMLVYGRRVGWRRGFDQGYGDALAISAIFKPTQDRPEMVADPAPCVVGEGCNPAAEVYHDNVVPVSAEIADGVLRLHNYRASRAPSERGAT